MLLLNNNDNNKKKLSEAVNIWGYMKRNKKRRKSRLLIKEEYELTRVQTVGYFFSAQRSAQLPSKYRDLVLNQTVPNRVSDPGHVGADSSVNSWVVLLCAVVGPGNYTNYGPQTKLRLMQQRTTRITLLIQRLFSSNDRFTLNNQ